MCIRDRVLDDLDESRRPATGNLVGYARGRLKSITETARREQSLAHVPDPPIHETHDLVDVEHEDGVEVLKVWKPKPETSKLVTRDDGKMYQKISFYTFRISLATPKDSPNMLDPKSYTGERLTEGIYESGEKFTDRTKWYPEKPSADVKDLECRRMKERWKGDLYLQLKDDPVEDASSKPHKDLCDHTQQVSPDLSQQLDKLILKHQKKSFYDKTGNGWTYWEGFPTLITRDANNFCVPVDKYPQQFLPLRTTYVRWDAEGGKRWKWYKIEDTVEYSSLDEPTSYLVSQVPYMVTVFLQEEGSESESDREETDPHLHAIQLVSKRQMKPKRRYRMIEICTATMQMTVRAVKKGWHGCPPITIETGFDLLTKDGREKGFARLKRENPDVIVAEWPCDPQSSWQHVNVAKGDDVAKKIYAKQKLHLPLVEWIAKVERWQRQRGKLFVGEQPGNCGSWKLPQTQEMQENNWCTMLDMCRFGLKDPFDKMPYRHRMKLVHGSSVLHKALHKLCPGTHEHAITQGNTKFLLPDGTWKSIDKTKFAGWYTPQFLSLIHI